MKGKTLAATLAVLLSLPSALAFRSNFAPLDRAVSTIAQVFYFPSLQNQLIAVNAARFVFFIIIFTLLYWVSLKLFQGKDYGVAGQAKKTAAIISLCLALISVWFIGEDVLLTNVYMYSVIIWTVIGVAPAAGALYIAFGSRDGHKFNDWLGLAALFVGFLWTWASLENLLEFVASSFPHVSDTVEVITSYAFLILIFAFIWKIISMIMKARGGDDGEGDGGRRGRGDGGAGRGDGPGAGDGPDRGDGGRGGGRGPRPNHPRNLHARRNAENGNVELQWDPPHEPAPPVEPAGDAE